MVSAFLLCVSFEILGFWGLFGAPLFSRRLTAPAGLRVHGAAGPPALGAKGSACDRLRLTGRLRASALGRYIVLWGSCIGPPSQPK